MNTMVLLIGQNLNFAVSSLDVADALQKAKDQKVAALADVAAKAKPKEHHPGKKSRHELAAADVPAGSIEAFVDNAQKHYHDAVSAAHTKLREANEQLRAMKSGTTNSGIAAQAKSQGADFVTNHVRGQIYYLFPDADTKQKCVEQQQKIADRCGELVKKLDDPQQGLLNYLKNGGPELALQTVGDVGFVPDLIVGPIDDTDEFQTFLGKIPIAVRGFDTGKLAIGSKLDGRVMYIAGTETFVDKKSDSKINAFVLREMPDEVLQHHLMPATSAVRDTSSSPSTQASSSSKASASPPAESTSADKQKAAEPKPDDFRTWVDKTGKFKFEAQFVATVDDKVILKARDGTVRTIPVSSLSPPDQAYLNRTK
jgi:hypothetical protein